MQGGDDMNTAFDLEVKGAEVVYDGASFCQEGSDVPPPGLITSSGLDGIPLARALVYW